MDIHNPWIVDMDAKFISTAIPDGTTVLSGLGWSLLYLTQLLLLICIMHLETLHINTSQLSRDISHKLEMMIVCASVCADMRLRVIAFTRRN